MKTDDIPLTKLKAEGYEVYIVGGAVRDILLGHPLNDIDLTVFGGDYTSYAALLSRRFRTAAVPFKDNIRLPLGKRHIDVSAPRGESIGADLALRDFTINNLALTLGNELLGDPSDIYAKKIVPAHPRSLLDDPLRILRAFRFAATLGFELTDEFFALLPAALDSLQLTAKERVRYELRCLSAACPNDYVRAVYSEMAGYGVLKTLFGFTPDTEKIYNVLKSACGKAEEKQLFPLFLAAIYINSGLNLKKEFSRLTLSTLEQNTARDILRLSGLIFGGEDVRLSLWEAENLGLKQAVTAFGEIVFGKLSDKILEDIAVQDNRKGDIINGEDILALSRGRSAGAWIKTVLSRTKTALAFAEIEGKEAALEFAGKLSEEFL
jgi:tRNA nucleotidyltransferase/poly(A) polymerase